MAEPEVGKEILYLTQQDVVDAGLGPDDVLACVRTALTDADDMIRHKTVRTGGFVHAFFRFRAETHP